MKENILKEKSYKLAIEIIIIYKYLSNNQKEFVLSKQILRSWTSIGACIREAEYAQSKLDFIHKMSISLKEANETHYWLELLKESDYISETQFQSLSNQCTECIKLLTSSIKTAKWK